VSKFSDVIRHYRKQADALQAELDQLTDPRWLKARVASLTKRRDTWTRLADELTDYEQHAGEPTPFEEGA